MHLHRIEIEAFRKQPDNEVNSLRMTLSLYQSPMKYTILEENYVPEGAPEDFEPVDRKEYERYDENPCSIHFWHNVIQRTYFTFWN